MTQRWGCNTRYGYRALWTRTECGWSDGTHHFSDGEWAWGHCPRGLALEAETIEEAQAEYEAARAAEEDSSRRSVGRIGGWDSWATAQRWLRRAANKLARLQQREVG